MSAAGRCIAITRGPEDAAEFVGMVESRGGRALALPTIRLVARGGNVSGAYADECRGYDPDHIVFMSSRAVSLLFGDAEGRGVLDEVRLLTSNANVVSVGPKTSAMLKRHGIRVNAEPESTYSSVGIGEVFSHMDRKRNRVLVPRSGASTPFLGDLLRKTGFDVRELHLYDVRPHDGGGVWRDFAGMLRRGEVDGMVFTSASSVRAFFDIMGRTADYDAKTALNDIRVVSIGPFTSEELGGAGVRHRVAPVHTAPGSLGTLCDMF